MLQGPKHLVEGFKLIFTPGLRRFFAVPIGVNIVVFILIVYVLIGQFNDFMAWFMARLSLSPDSTSWWMSFVYTAAHHILWILFALVTVLMVFYTFTIIANLLAAPFNGILAEKVEAHLTGEISDAPFDYKKLLADIIPMLINEMKKLAYLVVFGLIFLLFSLIPVIGMVFPLVWGLFTAWMLALEYISYPMENHGIMFKKVREMAKQKRMICFSFGLAVMAATLVPGINLLVMPAAVAAGTIMWVNYWKDGQKTIER